MQFRYFVFLLTKLIFTTYRVQYRLVKTTSSYIQYRLISDRQINK